MWFVFTFEVQLLHLTLLGFLPGGPSQRSKVFLAAASLQTRPNMALKLFASEAAVNCRTHLRQQFGEEQSLVHSSRDLKLSQSAVFLGSKEQPNNYTF